MLSVAAARLTAKNITRSFHASRTVASNIAPFKYQEVFDLAPDLTTEYRKLEGSEKLVSEVKAGDMSFLKVEPEALRMLSAQAMRGKRGSLSEVDEARFSSRKRDCEMYGW
jgi:hypothetical protein